MTQDLGHTITQCNITITILDIILYLFVSVTGFCLRLQAVPIQLIKIGRTSLCLQTEKVPPEDGDRILVY
jgi:hypothetical protein